MRSYLAKPMMLSVVGSLMMAGGCVSDAQYKEALAAARRANEQLVNCQNAVRDLRVENQNLQDAIKNRDAAIAARDSQLAQLQIGHDKLLQSFNDLRDKYQKAIASGSDVQPIGTIVLPAALDKALRKFAQDNPEVLEYLPEYGMVKLKSDLTFEPGSVDIKTASGDALRQFVQILNGPDAARFNVYIAGHTDDIPIKKPGTREQHPDNWYLSVHRSVAVEKVMTRAGLESRRIGVMGFGEYHPIAPNAPGNKGNVANRRVEIWIVPPDRFLTAGGQAAATPAPAPAPAPGTE
jgi:chemotaxis protein MotB